MIIVSTDGSCLRNPGGAIGWAWIAHEGGRFDSGGAASGTNQVAELTAVLRAIEAHPGGEPLLIESDSQYAIRCSSEWIEGWKRKGWRTASGSPVKNLELVQAIDRAITQREGPVRFRWVRGHVGNPFNERADQLAGLAAQDWAAGRGDVGSELLPASPAGDAEPETARRRTAAPAPVPAAGATVTPAASQPSGRPAPAAEPQWELGTLFD
ncbi:ribonuclease HI [Xylanimonas oleitrophica]|uniref:ribonuclease H n=1 Tax=Xylanimonas oleitrophica TaxID=2607479 RepID=A0A2W5XQB0_9MICO|nr:ribonuclease H [Xylanimonas oleitrophica]PZR51698.1 ribonuclease HI [Xylanimonas oleitrophica]